MNEVKDQKPVLRSYVFFSEVDEGVYFNGGSEKSFILPGQGLYPVVSKLISAMDGSRTVEQLVEALPEKVTPVFLHLHTQLDSRGLLANNSTAHEVLSPDIRARYEDVLSYLRDVTNDHEEIFNRWRETSVAVIGNGFSTKSCLRALAGLGVGSVVSALEQNDDRPTESEIMSAILEHESADEDFVFESYPSAKAMIEADADVDVAVLVSDSLYDLSHADEALSHFTDRDIPVHIAGVIGGEGFVVPNVRHRRHELMEIVERRRAGDDPASQQTITSCSVIGNLIAYELLRVVANTSRIFNIPNDAAERWCLHISAGPEITLRPLFSVPDRESVSLRTETEAPVADADTGETVEEIAEQTREGMEALFDPMLGILSNDIAEDLAQLPLAQEAFAVHFPRSYGRSDAIATGYGFSPSEAYLRALYRALATYADGVHTAASKAAETRFSAARTHAEWFGKALLDAVLHSDLATSELVPVVWSEDDVDSENLRLLRSVIEASGEGRLEVDLMTVPALPFYYCVARTPEETGVSVAATPLSSIETAMAELCSSVQLGNRHHPTDLPILSTDAAGIPLSELAERVQGDLITGLGDRGYTAVQEMFHADDAVVRTGVVVGQIILVAR